MRLFNKVAIVGVGLIGGSLALAIKKERLACEIIGVSRHKKSLLLARKKGAIDTGSQALDVISNADLLILATPVDAIINLAPLISKIIKKECIVFDVGSTKKEIVSKLEKLFPNYVGSHPLAGSEKRSIKNAYPGIFKNSLCVLTPTKNTPAGALSKIKKLWCRIGARIVLLSPEAHDKILSFISHLPHLTAFSLMSIIPKKYLRFASSGLKDSTRVAASDSCLWSGIFLSNRKNIIKNIELLQANLSRIKSAVRNNDKRRLKLILDAARKKRGYLVHSQTNPNVG